MPNLNAIIRVSNYVCLNSGLQRARPLWSVASDKLIMPINIYANLDDRGCEEIVFEHLEQLASPNCSFPLSSNAITCQQQTCEAIALKSSSRKLIQFKFV